MSDAPAYGLSWDGHNIYSNDKRSIDAVKAAIHKAAQVVQYREEFVNRHEKQAAEIEQLKVLLERTAKHLEGNWMEGNWINEPPPSVLTDIHAALEALK